jgi:hypothetical protein
LFVVENVVAKGGEELPKKFPIAKKNLALHV